MDYVNFYAWKKGTSPKRAKHYFDFREMREKKGISRDKFRKIVDDYEYADTDEELAQAIEEYKKKREEEREQSPSALYKKYYNEIIVEIRLQKKRLKILNLMSKLIYNYKGSRLSDEFLEIVRKRTKCKCERLKDDTGRDEMYIYIDPENDEFQFNRIHAWLYDETHKEYYRYYYENGISRTRKKIEELQNSCKNFGTTLQKALSIAKQLDELNDSTHWRLKHFIRDNVEGIKNNNRMFW